MSFVCARVLSICTRMPFVCHSYVLVCTRMSSVCHSYVLVCHPYVTRIYSYVIRILLVCTRMYSYVIRISLACTRMSFVCLSYVLVYHSYVTLMHSYVIRMSLVRTHMSSVCHSYVSVCHSYLTRMCFFHEPHAILSCEETQNPIASESTQPNDPNGTNGECHTGLMENHAAEMKKRTPLCKLMGDGTEPSSILEQDIFQILQLNEVKMPSPVQEFKTEICSGFWIRRLCFAMSK